jgi:hypothetical protein
MGLEQPAPVPTPVTARRKICAIPEPGSPEFSSMGKARRANRNIMLC